MERELRDALRAGAIGLHHVAHRPATRRPTTDRSPRRLATWDEVCRLVGVMGDLGTGIFEIATESTRGTDPDRTRRGTSTRMRDLAVETGVPITFGVRAHGRPRSSEMLDLIDATAAAGGRMFGQTHSRGISVVLVVPDPTALRRAARVEARCARCPSTSSWRRSATRAVAPEARRRRAPRRLRPGHRRRGPQARLHADARLRPPGAAQPDRRRGRRRARRRSRRADHRPRARDRPSTSSSSSPSPRWTTPTSPRGRCSHPRTVMTFSDAGAHVSQICRLLDPDPPARLLGARAPGVHPRGGGAHDHAGAGRPRGASPTAGCVREGFVADLNVFDPDRGRARACPRSQHDLPARRAPARAEGHGLPRHRRRRRGGAATTASTPAPYPGVCCAAPREVDVGRTTPRAVARRRPTRASGGTRAATARPPSTRTVASRSAAANDRPACRRGTR